MSSIKIPNNTSAQNAFLNSVKSDALKANLSNLSQKEQVLAESIINNIFASYLTQDKFENNIKSVSIDATLGRIASLLDEVKNDFTSNELEHVKQATIQEIQNILADPDLTASDKIDIHQLSINIASQIQDIQTNLIEATKKQIQEFILNSNVEQNTNLQQTSTDTIDAIVNDIESTLDQSATNIKDNVEKTAKPEPDSSKSNSLNTLSSDIEKISNEILKLNIFTEKIFLNINVNLLNISDKIDSLIIKINKVIKNTAVLLPTSKTKKENKKLDEQNNKLEKTILKISNQIDTLYTFVTQFADNVASHLQDILNKIFSKVVKFWLKLMVTYVVPILVLVGAALYLLAEPLMSILQPLMNTIEDIFGKILTFLEPIRDFVLKTLKSIFDLIEPALIAFFEGLASVAEPVAVGLCLFVNSVLKVLTLLMKGLASGAFALGKALVILATMIINTLTLFMKGIKPFARAIGEGLGIFVATVLDVLCFLMNGIKQSARAIGEAVGKVVLALVEVLELLIMFLENCVGILVAIVGSVRDFFEGLRSNARAIGEMLGTVVLNFFKGIDKHAKKIGEAVAELCLVTAKILIKIVDFFFDFKRAFETNVVVPFNALRRKLNVLKVKAAETEFSYPNGFDVNLNPFNFHFSLTYGVWKPFAWLTGGMTQSEIDIAKFDKDKSIMEMQAEELQKMEEKFNEEDKAAELDNLRTKLNEDKMKQMVENIHIVDELFQLSKSLHSFVKGEDSTEAVLAAVKTTVSDLNEVEQIELNDQQVKTDLQNQLQEEKQESVDQMADGKKTEAEFLKSLISYLTQNFNTVFDKVKNPNINVLPVNINSDTNVAAMEDM